MSRSDQALVAVAELTGDTPSSAHQLGGGDAAAAFEVRLADGGTVFAKTAGDGMPGASAAEAASLTWLAEAGSVPVPAVHGHDDRWLVTDHISTASPTKPAAEELGRGLARLHAAGAPAHGAPPPGGPTDAWIGLAPMRNEPALDWPSFYAAHRIEPYLRRAVDSGTLTAQEGEVITQVCTRLDDLAGPAEPPARLHGDLWNGNVHWGEDSTGVRAWLIDPAAHGGHRETDLAMLQLFGCPHLERVLSSYEEAYPLSEGWRDRVGLHQLFPLLVHAVLFGRGFATRAVTAARSALG
ncbi:fructosamine-3-kinase [Halopolyspora algeriensis]|uniref:Fructosamine-3-kinase n=1 Tax=Halopolyspora algeriensis TaxID=1500506 RepID=A0A368VNM0_9ACTN|nr:fructosamine kinase family protein [Halopolyspora algeriensis]RCW40703.1 fructosamine-3-kinase [Halopolyspora algeriensis]TQM53374.1 fructosamine-3-kinase [Halopolyspora algeriensis]